MKLIITLTSLLVTTSALAVDPYSFNCDLSNGTKVESVPGLKQAPDNPVVGLNIKVLKDEVPLFLVQAKFTSSAAIVKSLFVTDWVTVDHLSQKGHDLLSLLSLVTSVDTDNVVSLRAAIPSDLLDDFAYLELKDKSGKVSKLGFKGIDPSTCK